MNILYLHGFQSSSNSSTVNYLKTKINKSDNFYFFDLPESPELAIKFISDKIKELSIDILIGTSLGGVYAYNFELPKICINPAFQFNLQPGNYKFFNTRSDNKKTFNITDNDVEWFNTLCSGFRYKPIKDKLFYLSYILIGTKDTYVSFDKLKDYTNKYDSIIYHDFEHRLDNNTIDTILMPILDKLKQAIETLNKLDLHE